MLLISGAAGAAEVRGLGLAGTVTIDTGWLGALPRGTATLTFGSTPVTHVFEGPLLWAVLVEARLVDAGDAGSVPRQILRIEGADGYRAVVAMGEVSPAFEGKGVLLAETMDGQALERPRVVIPGDRRAARSVRDVVGLVVEVAAK